MNHLMADIFERLSSEASALTRASKGQTVGSKSVEAAVKLVLPGELAQHANDEGRKACTKF